MPKLLYKLMFFSPALILMVLINYIVDPANNFSGDDYSKQVADLILEKKVVQTPISFDQRLLQRHIINAQSKRMDIIVVGSSRSRQIRSSHFPGRVFLNHCVNRGALQDYIAVFELYHKKAMDPRKIILGLDPWILNLNNGIEKWQSFVGEYWAFSSRLGLNISLKESLNIKKMTLSRYFQLLSPGYFQKSFKILLLGKEYLGTPPVALEYNPDRVQDGYQPDGSTVSLAKMNRSIEEIRELAVAYANMEPVPFLDSFTRLSPELMTKFEAFIRYIKKENIEVVFFLPPFHPVAYKILCNRNGYKIIQEVEIYFRNFADENNIKVYGSYDPLICNVMEGDFVDGAHIKDTGITKIFGSGQKIGVH